jgi:excisionase family DNA binding protein
VREVTDLLTPAEAAEALRVEVKTLVRWADKGALPVVRTVGGHRRFPRTAVEPLATPVKRARRSRNRAAEFETVTLELPTDQLDWLTFRASVSDLTMSDYVARSLDAHRRRVESKTGR